MFLKLSLRPCMYGITMCPMDLLVVVLPLPLLMLFCLKFLASIPSNAQGGYLDFVRTSLKCSFLVLSSSVVEPTVSIP